MLALSKITNIEYIVDSAKFKQGRYTPVMHLNIVPPEHLKKESVDLVIIMVPGLYPSEVKKTIKKMNVDVVLDDATDTTVTAAQIHPALEGATLSNGADDAGNAGVVVSDIERGAPAARIGLQSDDVIIGVNRVRTSTVAEFRNALDEAKGVIALNVKRGNSTLYLVIRQ